MAVVKACHGPDQKLDSKSSADRLNNMKDSVADSSRSLTNELVMTVTKDDAKFAVTADNRGLAEVELGSVVKYGCFLRLGDCFGEYAISLKMFN
jgi:hypothetical protein